MKKYVVLTALLFAATSLGTAQSQSLGDAKNTYNSNNDAVPSFLANIIGDERINVEINESGDVREIGVVMDGIEAEKVQEGGVENATVNAYVHERTLKNISSSDQPLQATVDALKSDRIEYSATTTGGKVKMAVIDLFTDLIDLVL